MRYFKSIARWPRGFVNLGDPNNESEDTHGTREQAQAVCDMLEARGFGGDRRIFPISTRVEEVIEPPLTPDQPPQTEPPPCAAKLT